MIDLENLKIEDLEEVTDGYWPQGEDMILASPNNPHARYIETIYFIKSNHEYGIVINNKSGENDSFSSNVFKAYKIPKPQTRDMNSLEVMEYLHTFQQWLNGNKKELLQCGFPTNDLEYEVAFNNNLSDGNFDGGIVIYCSNDGKYSGYTEFNQYDDLPCCRFAILKNGKVTEFELPQIEVTQ